MRGQGSIREGQMFYSKELSDYIKQNEGSECDIEIIVLNKPEHYLYRYLFGFLIKDIHVHSGMSIDEIHITMKDQFAKAFITDWIDIPKRHRKKCERYERIRQSGVIERWYIKSCSSMTHEELMEYVKNVENHFFDFMEGAIKGTKQRQLEAYELRKKGMMSEKELKKYRRENE